MTQQFAMKKTPLALACALLATSAAFAQEAAKPAAPESDGIERVTVTATKRATLLQDTPLAVTAFNQATLDRAGVNNLASLIDMVPSLKVEQHGDSGGVHVFMRGVGSTNHTELGDPAVAFHVDGVYSPRPQGATVLMYDLDHVEVARGPQGTLSGRNATAGSVNLETAKPRLGKFSGAASAVIGDYNHAGSQVMLNIPLTETAAFRIAAITDRHDGYIDFQPRSNVQPGTRKYMAGDQAGARATLLLAPNSDLDATLAVEYYRDQGTGNIVLNPTPRPGQPLYSALVDTPGSLDQNNITYRGRVNYRLNDALETTYIGSWSRLKRTNANDNDAGLNPGFKQEHRTEWSQFDNYTHELQLKSTSDGPLQWIVGAFAIKEDNKIRFDIDISQIGLPAGLGPIVVNPVKPTDVAWAMSFIQAKRELNSKAAFAQGTYTLSKDLRVTAGGRYTVERKTDVGGRNWVCPDFGATVATGGHLIGPGGPVTAATCNSAYAPGTWSGGGANDADTGNEGSATYLGRVEYNPMRDVMTYASISTGFKSGGLSDGGRRHKAEHVTNYELGLKSEFLNRTVSFNASLFMMKYKDMQVSAIERQPNGQQQLVTSNAARSTINGLETEFTWHPTRSDRIMGNATLLDAKYDDFLTCDSDVAADCSQQANIVNLKGNKLPHTPGFSLTAAYEHDFAMGAGKLTPRVSVHYEGDSYLSQFNSTPVDAARGWNADSRKQKAYSTLDLSVRYEPLNKSYLVEGFVMNATDKAVMTAVSLTQGVWAGFYNNPRTMGARVSYKF
ncbi:MAG: TonB-dependent receptor [Pseudomonadota bacterium]